LAGNVVIERHGGHAKLAGDLAHGDRFQVPGTGYPRGGRADHARRQRGVHRDDRGAEDGKRVPLVPVGALPAAGLSVPVTAGDDRFPAAGGTAGGPAGADAAAPVLAAALERAQLLAAVRADRRGDHRGAGLAQCDQQAANDQQLMQVSGSRRSPANR
jgi:hypothetical protein